MRDSVQYATREHIVGMPAVIEFLNFCMTDLGLGIGFHPDTNFNQYVHGNGRKKFTEEEIEELNNTLQECVKECKKSNRDIVTLWLVLYQPLFDKNQTGK